MSSSKDLQDGAVRLLKEPRALVQPDGTTVTIPALTCGVVARRDKELKSEIEQAIANFGICVQVFPPLPTSALQRQQNFVFFDGAKLTVRIFETPAANKTGKDCYEVLDNVALLLHFTNPGGVCAAPMMLAKGPCAMVESPTQRIIDVFFTAVYQLNGTP